MSTTQQTLPSISKYVPKTGLDPAPAMKLIALSATIGMAFGFIGSFLGLNGVYVTGLVPMVLGLCLGAVLAFARKMTMNRSIITTVIAATVATILCVGFMHWFEFRQFVGNLDSAFPEERQIAFLIKEYKGREDQLSEHVRNEMTNRASSPETLEYLQIHTFTEYMAYKTKCGGQVKPGKASLNKKGSNAVYSTWGIEWLLMTGLVVFVASRSGSPPLCKECQMWMTSSNVGRVPGKAKDVATRIESGDVLGVKHVEPTGEATGFSVFRCPQCKSNGTAVLDVQTVDNKNPSDSSGKSVGMFVASEAKLAELMSILPEKKDEAAKVLDSVNELGSTVRKELDSASAADTDPDSAVKEYMAKLMNREEQQ